MGDGNDSLGAASLRMVIVSIWVLGTIVLHYGYRFEWYSVLRFIDMTKLDGGAGTDTLSFGNMGSKEHRTYFNAWWCYEL